MVLPARPVIVNGDVLFERVVEYDPVAVPYLTSYEAAPVVAGHVTTRLVGEAAVTLVRVKFEIGRDETSLEIADSEPLLAVTT